MKIKELIKLDLRIPNHEKLNKFRKFIEKTLNKKKVFISILKKFKFFNFNSALALSSVY
jgi:hypothetical protein